jgi:hypothetical protein
MANLATPQNYGFWLDKDPPCQELHLNLGVYNPSKETAFDFNLLLHSYFKCPDVR